MRLGVLDVGSNTVHLVMVDARRGGHPTPMSDSKSTMKLVEYLDKDNNLSKKGIDKLTGYVAESKELVEQMKCEEMISFATSAVRDAANADEVLAHVEKETGIKLQILSGEEEARLTFLAVRRWYGWSAGRLINLDIGGGSLELTSGNDEDPEAAYSLLLGAGRLTHEWFETDPPERKKIDLLRDYIDAELAEPARHLRTLGEPDLAVATSKTFRTLARLTGAAPSAAGPRVKRTLTAAGLRQLIAFISRMTAADRAELEGVSANRSHQIVAGALVAEASMRALGLEKVEICPWALREGIIFRRLDSDLYGKG
ncbi:MULTISPECIES: Ppx/GppA family phosphatase [Corynebacterium]|uniref:Ppx/GppA phosphatase family protein n=1 Tax=Corynebacterium TaxID=1716 RepID=UPI0009783DCA|nr:MULTISPECIES: Ppx/GppA phosphatase family protein [Corynebacterium]MCQ9126227.1 Ppx/GppA family phosphatase [Corynebacterium amycolatum]MCQ9127380.1 Ppx/GppA family phosphatase [Corynebacterium amycolatum]MCQ9142101.1 Ppx/GppA family phosphatase [Corynebacterium amycolatum]MCQ9166727.1 Ppx/GppA family phosphatase [Corynebacterium amycolatum]MCQ9170235.1 Ppx/GppA family phosphatase [Corynebacterium amycolatum]